ncbi:hypothetical protein CEXT_76881 [Caerostris extrusa]|uniref:Uncharacterized protein n=1 Tax=Caerostris extrusa TaxID=172846 RepID=A0AAV4MKQ5_CAEEX|nr:hypothetical protein CEXT_76881 [Caerostris extrusa]
MGKKVKNREEAKKEIFKLHGDERPGYFLLYLRPYFFPPKKGSVGEREGEADVPQSSLGDKSWDLTFVSSIRKHLSLTETGFSNSEKSTLTFLLRMSWGLSLPEGKCCLLACIVSSTHPLLFFFSSFILQKK